MEHLSLEIFDRTGTGSKYAMLPDDTSITITDTSEVFASGDVWSHSFTLNTRANAHIFGTAGEMHGSRLHEQINKRRARLWVEGLPLYLGYLKLDDEVNVDEEGNVDVSFESGQKTFDEKIEGVSAREVSVGDVVVGVALNRKRTVVMSGASPVFKFTGLNGYAAKDSRLEGVDGCLFSHLFTTQVTTPHVQRWPKLVKSHGKVLDSSGSEVSDFDYTNIQSPYDASHPFCNINICYPLKANKDGEEVATRGYTKRLAWGNPTTNGGDNETRFNNSPNFYLLHFINRLFKDIGIHIEENQAYDVEDLRRVFMLNYGCHYEEIEDSGSSESEEHTTPGDKLSRYGQYYIPFIDPSDDEPLLVKTWEDAGKAIVLDDLPGKVLLRDLQVEKDGVDGVLLEAGSVEGEVLGNGYDFEGNLVTKYWNISLVKTSLEETHKAYSAYLAYATGDNYPNVDISEIIDAMKAMFGVRLLFSNDFQRVRIVLLRNIFRSPEVQNLKCDILSDSKVENCRRGFRMTYGKGTEDTSFYYKGFNDKFPRAAVTWRDTSDRHDYSQWNLDADYGKAKQESSALNRRCYVTPVNGNAYLTKIDEEEDVLFPSLLEVAGFMDAEDGDCTGESETIEEVQIGATPVIMNDINGTYASLFSGEMRAPSPANYKDAQKIATFGRMTTDSITFSQRRHLGGDAPYFTVSGKLDIYISEGFQIRMMDNYGISNTGTPFDDADPGLCFGIMRGSGEDAKVNYYEDPEDGEDNQAWDVIPGSGAIDHPDTCDPYGNEWDYNGSFVVTPITAIAKLQELFPNSDAPFNDANLGYITNTTWINVADSTGRRRVVLLATEYSIAGVTVSGSGDIRYFVQLTLDELLELSRTTRHMVIEVDSSDERGSTLVQLCKFAYGGGQGEMIIDNGVGSRYGRFSLKLRAEKLNPYFDPTQVESSYNRRYLPITNENLRRRGLCDTFYKEYSYWARNARIAKMEVRMELAQLLSIDKTKRVTVGDITGFIRKMQYSIDKTSGLGNVTMEVMYI